jgi:hypothetical protein
VLLLFWAKLGGKTEVGTTRLGPWTYQQTLLSPRTIIRQSFTGRVRHHKHHLIVRFLNRDIDAAIKSFLVCQSPSSNLRLTIVQPGYAERLCLSPSFSLKLLPKTTNTCLCSKLCQQFDFFIECCRHRTIL